MTAGSLHYKDGVENNPWPKDVTASRTFRTLPAGKDAYNYRSKVLMGMAQTRVLNEPPSTTPKDAVTFSLPSITKPDTPEGIMMLSVLEMQSLLRSGEMTSMPARGRPAFLAQRSSVSAHSSSATVDTWLHASTVPPGRVASTHGLKSAW